MNLTCFPTLEGLPFWRGENKRCTQINIKCHGKWFLILRTNNGGGKLAVCWPSLEVLLICCCCLVPESHPVPSAPWTVALGAPLALALSRQQYWSGLPFSSPGDLPDPGTKPTSPALACRFFTSEPPGESLFLIYFLSNSQNKLGEVDRVIILVLLIKKVE